MAERENWSVSGYMFATKQDAELAENEVVKIQKLEDKLDYRNPKMVKLVFDKTIENRVFKTQVGYDFLKKLQEQLKEEMPEEEIQDIPIAQIYQLRNQTAPAAIRVETPHKKVRTQEDKKKDKYRFSLALNFLLVILVGIMFYISTTSTNPNIINYEKAIQNKYAQWEQELSTREQTIREKEKELLIEN